MKTTLCQLKYEFLVLGFLLLMLSLFKHFNFTWVEMKGEQAKVTINFLMPMDQKAFESHIKLESERDDSTHFVYETRWLNKQTVEIILSEKNEIRGLKVKLFVEHAPTKYKWLSKSEKVTVQFSVPIEVKEQDTVRLISSTDSFKLSFNTPIKMKELSKAVASEEEFVIKPYQTSSTKVDNTCFILTPKQPLKNGKEYAITILSGLRACSGSILLNDIYVYLKVDQKPTITATYPGAGDKWIGLYPKITFTSKQPIVAAIAKMDGETLNATLTDDYHGYFLLKSLLKPMTTYTLQIQTKAESGERSPVKEVIFSTTSINEKRAWLEICCGDKKCLHYYEGNKKIKTFICGIGKEIHPSDYGTYYLQGKSEVYEDNKRHQGANYWMSIDTNFGIHGYTRDSYWEIESERTLNIGGRTEGKNIVLSDEDAKWLFEKVTDQVMIIIRE